MSTTTETNTEALPPQRILVVDDEKVIGIAFRRVFDPEGHEVEAHEDPHEGLQAALTGDFDVIFLDWMMPGADGFEILRAVKAAGVRSEVVIITGHSTIESAVQAIRDGASDYLAKPFTPDQLRLVLRKVVERSSLIVENALLRKELEVNQGFEGIIGESRPMQRIFGLMKRVAPTDGTVLIVGESGTGKEMVVNAIHRLSRRRDKALLACDCSALAPTLLESELFGHVKGSFSGAISTKLGLFEAADKGTLFLDEVSNLSTETQGKLLRVLEAKKIKKVGDTAEQSVDIRLVTATNRDLWEMVESGEFREDLYYRLNVVPIQLPPLRERHGDIPRLAVHFLDRFCRKLEVTKKIFSPDALALIESYSWPGNVREMRNIIERIAILCEKDLIEPHHLPPEIQQTPAIPTISRIPETWDEFKRFKQQARDAAILNLERRFLTQALRRFEGNVSKAAEHVGMQRTNFHAMMRRCDLSVDDYK
ncbi:MAG: sigma-54-dependent transcriptional regulator [Pirellulaceae bacterium]